VEEITGCHAFESRNLNQAHPGAHARHCPHVAQIDNLPYRKAGSLRTPR
jgi:hypothetical protein